MPDQLQRSPSHDPWSDTFNKVHHVNKHYLVWFGLEVIHISCRGHKSSQKQSDYRGGGVPPGLAANTAKKLVDLR